MKVGMPNGEPNYYKESDMNNTSYYELPDVREECEGKEALERYTWGMIQSTGVNPAHHDSQLIATPNGLVRCPCCNGSTEHVYNDRFYPCSMCDSKGYFDVKITPTN